MKKIKTIILSFLMVFGMVAFAGCDFFNKEQYVYTPSLTNGSYEITAYSVNGVSETEFVGKYALVSGNTLTDWYGNTATIVIENLLITITWQMQTQTIELFGEFDNNLIMLNGNHEGNAIIIVLEHRQDATLASGSYEILVYSVNGVSEPTFIGEQAVISGSTMTDWFGQTAIITIRGNSVTFEWDSVSMSMTLSGVISNNTITIQSSYEGNNYIIVFSLVS